MNCTRPTAFDALLADADAALAAHLTAFAVATRPPSRAARAVAFRSMALSLCRRLSMVCTRARPAQRLALSRELRDWARAELTARFSTAGEVASIDVALATLDPTPPTRAPDRVERRRAQNVSPTDRLR